MKGERRKRGQTVTRITCHPGRWASINDLLNQYSHKLSVVTYSSRSRFLCPCNGDPKPNNAWHIRGPGAEVSLLCSSEDMGSHVNPFTDIEAPNWFWTIYLVGRHAQKINPKPVYIYVYLANSLNGVGVHQGSGRMGDACERLKLLHRPNLVVRETNADQHSIRTDRPLKIIWSNSTAGINRKLSHMKSLTGQSTNRM